MVNKIVAIAWTCKSSSFTKYSTEDVLIFSSKWRCEVYILYCVVGDWKKRSDVTVYTVTHSFNVSLANIRFEHCTEIMELELQNLNTKWGVTLNQGTLNVDSVIFMSRFLTTWNALHFSFLISNYKRHSA